MCQDGRIDFDRAGNRVTILATRKHPEQSIHRDIWTSFKECAQRYDSLFLPEVIAYSEHGMVIKNGKFNEINFFSRGKFFLSKVSNKEKLNIRFHLIFQP